MANESGFFAQRIRTFVAVVLSAMLVATYLWLPAQREATDLAVDDDDAAEPARLNVVNVSPPEPYAGGLVVIDYANSNGEPVKRVFLGKQEMTILSQRVGTVVARLPNSTAVGHAKIRVGMQGERSKPYDIRIAARDWRKPFRDFLGGLALLVFGIGVFSRGAREAAGKGSADTLRKYSQYRITAFGSGILMGGFAQSTLAVAGLIAGLSATRLVTSTAAAAAFIGAQVGAGILPLATGLLDPRVGLLIVALGVLWLGVASDRRTSAFARLALGAGLVAFGLHLLRNGIEPLVVDKTLLRLTAGLQADSLSGVFVCVMIGAVLVAILQGAASALFVVVGLLQTVGQLDLRVVLAVLAGSGLGAALGALLTTRLGSRGRKLAELHLLLGVSSTLVAALTVDLWVKLATLLLPSSEPIATFGANMLMPHVSGQLAMALGCSQVASALAVLPLVTVFNRMLKPSTAAEQGEPTDEMNSAGLAREGLISILQKQREGLQCASELVLAGERSAGRTAEHRFAEARAEIESLLTRVIRVLGSTGEGSELRQAAFACLQLERSLEDLLFRAERFTDRQMAIAARGNSVVGIAEYEATTREMQQLLLKAVDAAIEALQIQQRVEVEGARNREIRLNALESQSRRAVLERSGDSTVIQVRLDILELLDAYEGAGNHLYRLAETLSGGVSPHRVASRVNHS